jgi:RNA polymerase sigma-70 factor (ECF subfamily)
MSGPAEITRLLAEWSGGNQAALDTLIPIIYDELRRLASNYMRGERPDHVLQTTALVNEAYMRLLERRNVSCQTRTQFFAVAAQVMRRVLVDYARTRNRAKRGQGAAAVSLDEVAVLTDDRVEELLSIHFALDHLTAFDARKGRVFELRYFGGMSLEEVAAVVGVSAVTVERDWKIAKLWLRREIAPGVECAT